MPAFDPTAPDKARPPLLARLRRSADQPASRLVRCSPGVLDSFEWPVENTLEALGRAIADVRGLGIVVRPIPEEMRHHEISGLTTVIGRTAHVFYDAELSPLNREQTILHEYAHILHGDVRADAECTHLRSMFEDPVEKRAETTGMQLLDALHRRRRDAERRPVSEVLDFLTGADEPRDAR